MRFVITGLILLLSSTFSYGSLRAGTQLSYAKGTSGLPGKSFVISNVKVDAVNFWKKSKITVGEAQVKVSRRTAQTLRTQKVIRVDGSFVATLKGKDLKAVHKAIGATGTVPTGKANAAQEAAMRSQVLQKGNPAGIPTF